MDSKISSLNLVETVTQDDVLPIVNAGETKKVKVLQLINGLATTAYVNSQDALKVDKVTNKGLSTEDYTTTEKNKLAGIAAGAEVNVNADWNATSGDAQILNKPTIPTAVTQTSQLTNNGSDGVNPFITALDIPIDAEASTLVREVKNMTGATLTKGTVVYISGANGNKALVSKALATTDALSSRTFGMLQSDILNNGLGNCVIIGDLTGLNTSTFAEGDQLYLSGVTAGTYTATKILAPTHLVYVGKVTRSHPTLGQIEVGIQNGYELEEIHDVAISGLANEDFLQYELSTDLWKNKPLTDTLIKSKLGITTLSGSNTGDNATNTQYSGLATSKQDTLQSTVNIKSINGNSILGSGNLTISAAAAAQSAFTILANNTNASAVPTEQVYKDIAEQTNLASVSTISWTGTAPTNPISLNYKWSQIGSLVTVRFNLVYTTAGASNGQVIITLPTDMPTPATISGFTSATDVQCFGTGSFSSSKVLPTVVGIPALRRNSTNTGYEFVMTRTTGSINTVWLHFTYYT
jgi:hypothetical protein